MDEGISEGEERFRQQGSIVRPLGGPYGGTQAFEPGVDSSRSDSRASQVQLRSRCCRPTRRCGPRMLDRKGVLDGVTGFDTQLLEECSTAPLQGFVRLVGRPCGNKPADEQLVAALVERIQGDRSGGEISPDLRPSHTE
jgi:hypothetical protein